MTAVADAMGITRQHLSTMRNGPPPRRRGRPPLPDAELVTGIGVLIAGLPTYGYRRVHALLRRQAEKVRVAFALDCCDREAMGHVATTGGITAEDVQDLMVATVEHRYGP